MILSLLNLAYIVMVKPYETENFLNFFNELTIVICLYMMVIFLDCDDVDFSTNVSWVFISINCFNMIFNLSQIIVAICKGGFKDIQKSRMKKKYELYVSTYNQYKNENAF